MYLIKIFLSVMYRSWLGSFYMKKQKKSNVCIFSVEFSAPCVDEGRDLAADDRDAWPAGAARLQDLHGGQVPPRAPAQPTGLPALQPNAGELTLLPLKHRSCLP